MVVLDRGKIKGNVQGSAFQPAFPPVIIIVSGVGREKKRESGA